MMGSAVDDVVDDVCVEWNVFMIDDVDEMR